MKKKEELVTFGLTEKQADEVMLLESRMMEEAVKFCFVKKDGTIREAVGTLKRSLMKLADGTLWEPKGEARPDTVGLMKYWDCEKQSWRSFNVGSLVWR